MSTELVETPRDTPSLESELRGAWDQAEPIERSGPLYAVALMLAESLDGARVDKNLFAIAQLTPRYVKILSELRLTPDTAPEKPDDGFAAVMGLVADP